MQSGLISIGIFLVIQLVAAVWWASAMNTKMSFILKQTSNTQSMFDSHVAHDSATYSTKSEVAQAIASNEKDVSVALAYSSKEILAIWKQIDSLKAKIGI